MQRTARMTWLGRFLTVITSGMVGVLALWVFTPWLAAIRAQALWAGAGVGGAALAVAVWMAWRQPSRVAMAVVVLTSLGPLALAAKTMQQRALRNAVMAAPPAKLAAVGRHVVVGYRTLGEVTPLIARGAVGGLFVTARNARGKTQAQLATEIAADHYDGSGGRLRLAPLAAVATPCHASATAAHTGDARRAAADRV
jgi:hypothetical protein